MAFRGLKLRLARAARHLGYTVVPSWELPGLLVEQDLARRFAASRIGMVIDVGANTGQYRDLLRHKLGFAGPIVSFEPNPRLAGQLAERALADPQWTVAHQALGAAPGHAEFNVMADTQFSSFLRPAHGTVTLFSGMNVVRERVRVEVATLDAVLPPLLQRHGAVPVHLKIDTQGFDLEVLKGAEASLGRMSTIQIEVSVQPIYEGAPPYHEIIRFLEQRGFVLSGIAPNNDGHFPLLVEFDCHFIRRDLATGLAGAMPPGAAAAREHAMPAH